MRLIKAGTGSVKFSRKNKEELQNKAGKTKRNKTKKSGGLLGEQTLTRVTANRHRGSSGPAGRLQKRRRPP